jgi:hypothetical protein
MALGIVIGAFFGFIGGVLIVVSFLASQSDTYGRIKPRK